LPQRALTDRSNNYSNIKQSKQSSALSKCNLSIVFNDNSYTNPANKIQRKRTNQSPLTNLSSTYRSEKPFTPQSIYKQELPSPKQVQKVCIDLVDRKLTCKEHNLKVSMWLT
jgi:hypothetical protein